MQRQHTRFARRRRQVVVAAVIAGLEVMQCAAAADLSQQMANMFGNGALANSTGPGVYSSQTQRIYMGGEMELRLPSRTYQLFTYTMPHINADCGGVDAYLGSFSHITSDQLRQMLEQVAAQYGALLFKAALKSINPLIESVIGDLQKTLESRNLGNANTCKLAQLAVDATAGPAVSAAAQQACITGAMKIYNDDLNQAQQRCRITTTQTNEDLANSSAPDKDAYVARDENLVFAALAKSSFTQADKELFMNIAGTVLLYAPARHGDTPQTPKYLDPSVDSLKTLLFGHHQGQTPDTVTINDWWSCDGPDCLNPSQQPYEITPFPTLVMQRLLAIRDNIINKQPLSSDQIAFINMTSVPIYRLVSLGTMRDADAKSTDMSDLLIMRYAKVIAYDYAYSFLRTALKDVRLYLHMTPLKDKVEESHMKEMTSAIEKLLDAIQTEHSKAAASIRDMRAVIEDLKDLERDMQTSMPASIRGMRNMSLLMSGRG